MKSGEDKKIVRWGAHTLDLDDEESTLDNPRRYATLLEHDGRGIVLTGGGQHVKALAAQISLLRRMGCTLPIEVWHHAELDPTTCRRLAELGSKGVPVRCRSTAEVASITSTVSVHHIKLLGVMLSSFKEVLALDADTVPLRDPTSVFAIPEYADHGALFWPGLHDSSTLSQGGESTKSNHVMWTISDVSFNGSDYSHTHEQGSGVLVVNKPRTWLQLEIALHFNTDASFYRSVLRRRSPDLLRFAWLATRKQFGYSPPALVCGLCDETYRPAWFLVKHRSFAIPLGGVPLVDTLLHGYATAARACGAATSL